VRFRTEILSTGRTATALEIPPEVIDALDAGRKPPVQVTIAGYTYRSTVASRGGRYLVGVNATNRERAGVAAGDVVDVDIELDSRRSQAVRAVRGQRRSRRRAREQHIDFSMAGDELPRWAESLCI
jgi:hypothetical protein